MLTAEEPRPDIVASGCDLDYFEDKVEQRKIRMALGADAARAARLERHRDQEHVPDEVVGGLLQARPLATADPAKRQAHAAIDLGHIQRRGAGRTHSA